MSHTLRDLSLTQLLRLHESLMRVFDAAGAESCRPCIHDGAYDVVEQVIDDIAEHMGRVEREMMRRPLNTYDDALCVYRVSARYLEGHEHLREVLSLLNHSMRKEAS